MDDNEKSGKPDGAKPSLSEYFGNVRVLGELSRGSLDRPWLTSMPKETPHHRYVVWLGCNIVRTAHLAETLDDVLRAIDTDFVSLGGPSHCCGIMHEAQGDDMVGNNMLLQTMKKIDTFTPEQMLVWCPSCDNQVATRDQSDVTKTAKERKSVAGFLERTVPDDKLRPVPMTIAIHWHGDFPEQREDGQSVHKLLARIPGMNVVAMPHAEGLGRHCTADIIGKIGKDSYRQAMKEWEMEAKRRGATHVVSVYHSCHRQLVLLQRGAADPNSLPVVNYLTLLARSLGLAEREDRFALLAKVDDIEDMMTELSSQAEALGVKPDQARRALIDQFINRS